MRSRDASEIINDRVRQHVLSSKKFWPSARPHLDALSVRH